VISADFTCLLIALDSSNLFCWISTSRSLCHFYSYCRTWPSAYGRPEQGQTGEFDSVMCSSL